MRTLNILITEVNSSYNKGDAAIVLGILKIINKKYPNSSVTVLTPTPCEDKKYYTIYNAQTHIQLYNYLDRKIPRIVYVFLYLIKMSFCLFWTNFRSLPVPKKIKKILDLYQNADIIISCSGGRLGGKKITPIFDSLIPIYFAKKLGKKVFVCAQSIEPFQNNFLKKITKFVLNRTDLISTREEISFNVLKSLHINTPIYLTADLAFLLDPVTNELAKSLLGKAGIQDNEKIKIGVTVTEWRIPGHNSKQKNLQYVNVMKKALDELLKDDVIIVFFPQVVFLNKEDDRILSKKIKNDLDKSKQSRVFVLEDNYTPHELKAMMGKMDIFIGKRLHSCIFALAMNVPSIVIGYEKKALGIMKMIDNQDNVININSMTADGLVKLVKKLLNEKKQKSKHLSEKILEIQDKALKNGDLLEKLIKDSFKS